MRSLLTLIIGTTLMAVSCSTPPEVAQGTVISCDEVNKTVAIQEMEMPDQTLEFSFAEADVGVIPSPGDTIRVAYHRQDGGLRATRIMNISRQKDLTTGK